MSSLPATSRWLGVVVAMLVAAAPGAALSPGKTWREAVEDNPLGLAAKVDIERTQPLVTLHIQLKNNSARSACIGSRAFNPLSNGISISDAGGRHVGEIRTAYYPAETFRGFDHTQAYYVLYSGKSLDFDVQLLSFALSPGYYSYKWWVPYYDCSEVVALEKGAKASKPNGFYVLPAGHITVTGR